MTFDRIVEFWANITVDSVPRRRVFVVESQLDALLLEGIDVEDPIRPDVIGHGRTVAWVYIERPNGGRLVVKIKAAATERQVQEVLGGF